MAGTVQAAPDDLITCEMCHGFYAVEVPPDGTEPRVKCNACGHIREVPITPVQQKSEDGKAGKWTVIGPDGKVMTYPSWEKLLESRHPSVMTEVAKVVGPGTASKIAADAPRHEEKRPSATALLDITPTPALPKLALAELDSDPNLLAAAPAPSALELAKSLATSKPPEKSSKGPEWAPIKSKAPPPMTEKPAEQKSDLTRPPPSIRELSSGALVDDGEDEAAPLSLRDAIVDEEEPAPLSLRDAIVEDVESAHEVLSLKDLQVVASPADSAVDSTPPPPARGVLKTLPPTSPKHRETAPPPTITVEEPPPSKKPRDEAEPTKTASKAKEKGDAKKSDKVPSKNVSKKASSKTTGATPSKDDREPVASAKAAAADEEPKRGWVLPSLAVAGIAIVIWRMMAASPAPEAPSTEPAPTAATTATSMPTASETATSADPAVATASEPPSTPVDTSTTTTTATTSTSARPATPSTTATVATADKKPATPASTDTQPAAEKKPAAPAESGMSMSDLLDRAGSAKRSGDYATARDLYGRVLRMNPGNVEANGGLGDVARAQGDLSAAKASYERALAASPAYGPAQLGLADTEWDLGNRASAQRRYAQIVERLGDRAPERAKQRGVVTE